MEFGNVKEGFYNYYLAKIGFKLNKKRVNFIVDCIPVVILVFGIVLQEVFDIVPFINIF